MHIQIEGIILEAKVHQTADCLLTLFSKEEGLIYAFVKYGFQSKHRLRHLLVPLTRVELMCVRKQNDLLFVSDGALVQAYTHIRKEEGALFAASQMAQALLQTLWQRHAVEPLYHLLDYYLQALAHFQKAEILLWSFWYKLLKYEGKFFPVLQCSVCKETLPEQIQLAQQQFICSHHDTEELLPISLTQQDVIDIVHLTHSRQLSELQGVELTAGLRQKLQQIIERFIEKKKR